MIHWYKSGRVRLTGKELAALRAERWQVDGGACRKCGIPTYFNARFAGDPQAYDMAHIKSRGAGGSDSIENVETLCHKCHMAMHTQGRKPENKEA